MINRKPERRDVRDGLLAREECCGVAIQGVVGRAETVVTLASVTTVVDWKLG